MLYRIDPLTDKRWTEFLERHPDASVFHSVAWLSAIRRTYGYEIGAYTSSRPGSDLEDAFVFCLVDSWITGRRIISLPFSDHCDILQSSPEHNEAIFSELPLLLANERCQYVEIRPAVPPQGLPQTFQQSDVYCLHQLDVRPDLGTLLNNLHKDSVRRKIKRAEREGLTYEEGNSAALVNQFRELFMLTRRRHGLPPQPNVWFQNLVDCFGPALKIRVAKKGDVPVASILTLQHKKTLVYKFGCSDAKYNNLGGTPLLFWRSIEEAKREGLHTFDLGRSGLDNEGLITFKDRWGAARSVLTYSRFTRSKSFSVGLNLGKSDWKMRLVKQVVANVPDAFLCAVGNVFYKHIG